MKKSTKHRTKAGVVFNSQPQNGSLGRVYQSHHNSSDKERTPKEFGSSLSEEKTWESSKGDKVICIYMKSANSLFSSPVPTI